MKPVPLLLAACFFASGASGAFAQIQGVTRDGITVGAILDLSGPVSSVGKPVLQGLRMRADELNDIGGVHGRKLRVIAEDSSYEVKKSVLAAQKLASQDGVFAVLGLLGTPMNIAAMPVLLERGVINFYPMSAARETYDPPHQLKAAFLPGNYDQIRVASARLVKDQRLKKPCVLHQDDDFGLEVVEYPTTRTQGTFSSAPDAARASTPDSGGACRSCVTMHKASNAAAERRIAPTLCGSVT